MIYLAVSMHKTLSPLGRTILHFKITEKLGEGGMGIVYKAEDIKLQREVAVKFLPHQISSGQEERKRFETEARAAATLNHPNIATVYSIEEDNDDLFIVMEYIDGIELKEKIMTVPVQVSEAVSIAIQIGEGLSSAHKKGIIHRDIKSSNIMITDDGKVKIMDFGLAKIRGYSQLTKEGTTIGTIAYMSPEQATGKEVDHRTDIWSFGVVLYELLTKGLPFKGDFDEAVIYSILNEQPEQASGINPAVPVQLDKIIQKCLKKDPKVRYQNLNELLSDLRKVKTNNAEAEKSNEEQPESIAILPFVNVGGSQENDYLGFALADQIIGGIAYIKNLLVRPSASVRKYINAYINPKDIGQELNVDYVLAGNFLKVEEKIRLNIELIETNTENLVWRTPIEVNFHNAFELQDIVAQRVVQGLNIQFSQKELNRIRKDIPDNPIAYEYYLRSLSLPSTNENDLVAVDMLKKSIQLESDYAPALAELGFRFKRIGIFGSGGQDALSRAEQFLMQALSLNDELLPALNELSALYLETRRAEKAVELAKRMLKINPNSASAHFALGYIYRYSGMLEESEKEFDQALSLDPGNPRFRGAGVTYHHLGKYEKSVKALNLDKGSSYSLIEMGMIHHHRNEMESALKTWIKLGEQETSPGFYSFYAKAMKAVIENKNEEAKSVIAEFEKTKPSDGELWYYVAVTYALTGDAAGTARALEEGLTRGYFNYPNIASNPFFDLVRKSDEFQRVLENIRIRHNNFREKFFGS